MLPIMNKSSQIKNSSFVAYLTMVNAFALMIAYVCGAYFRMDAAGLLFYKSQDGHCRIPQDSIGLHCFGDYSAIRFNSIFDTALPPGNVYPPSTRVLLLPFHYVDKLYGFRIGLVLFLAISAICLLVPIVIVTRKMSASNQLLLASLCGISTYTLLFTLDRGNPIALAVPGIFIFVRVILKQDRKNYHWAILALCSSVAIKPQFILFFALLFLSREYKLFYKSLIAGLSTILIPFLIYFSRSWLEFQNWMSAVSDWGQSLSMESNYPANYSFMHFFVFIGVPALVCTALVIVSGLFFLLYRWNTKRTHQINLIDVIVLTILIAFSNPINYGYYTVLFIPILAIYLVTPVEDGFNSVRVRIGFALTVSPLLIPSKWVTNNQMLDNETFNFAPLLVVGTWVLFLIVQIPVMIMNSTYWRNNKDSHEV